jgi:hypothetical protein
MCNLKACYTIFFNAVRKICDTKKRELNCENTGLNVIEYIVISCLFSLCLGIKREVFACLCTIMYKKKTET